MKKILSFAVIALAFIGCYNDKQDKLYPMPGVVVCDTSNVKYATDIKPIFAAKCNTPGCHDAASMGGGYNFTTHAGIQTPALNGKIVNSINWISSPMPKNLPKLSQCEIDKITSWVNKGALDN